MSPSSPPDDDDLDAEERAISPSSPLAPSAASSSGGAHFDSSYFKTIGPALATWLSFSIGLILFNKHLYISSFRFPVTLTACHMVFMTAATQLMAATGQLTTPKLGWGFYVRWIVPLAGMYAVSLAASNIAAQRLTVSFIQMIKAVTPLMMLAVSVFAGKERYALSLVLITAAMTLGVGVASIGELSFDALGFALQLIALTVESVRLVVIQHVMQDVLPKSRNPFILLSLFAPAVAVVLVPAAAVLEPGAWTLLALPSTGPLVFANACTALGLNAAVVWLSSQESGPLTLTLVGIVKDLILIVSSVFLFGNAITPTQVAGYSVALYALNVYHCFKAAKWEQGDKPPDILVIMKQAATDRIMATMAAGILCLFFISRSG